ncbi:MAG: GNAT family protein [Bacteroidota bacterium]
MELSIRELQENDIEPLTRYWLGSNKAFLEGMGVDVSKMPSAGAWRNMLLDQLNTPVEKKQSYCMIWLEDNQPVGHSNVNKIIFGQEAYMHLHLWSPDTRKKGMGLAFVQLTLPHFFEKLRLQKICCEPYALNPAPNRVLEKAGFAFIKSYVTTPGWINFEQEVNRWELSRKRFEVLYGYSAA